MAEKKVVTNVMEEGVKISSVGGLWFDTAIAQQRFEGRCCQQIAGCCQRVATQMTPEELIKKIGQQRY